MAISETILKNVMLMQIADLNAHGGLLGKQIEPVVVDPASNWPLFAEKARVSIGTQTGPLSASKRDPFRCGIDEANDVSLFG